MTKSLGIRPPRNATLSEKLAWFTRPAPDSDCLLWIGAKTDTRAGGTHGLMRWRGNHQKAHRLAWIVANGRIPKGKKVLHRCDTPHCVNPAHLFIGTQGDNVRDMHAKGRARIHRGAEHGRAKLTDEQVRAIRIDRRSGPIIAAEYGVTRTLVNMIRRGEIWRHLTTKENLSPE